jgi:6-phosphofructokinase 1
VTEIGLDVGSMATDDGSCCIVEVMGRSAGWIAAGAALAQRGNPDNAPQIILLPEVKFDREKFIAKVKAVVARNKYCIVVCGEGIQYPDGREVGADYTKLDDFGHPALAGASTKLKEIVEKDLNLKTRTVLLGYAQRAAAHYGSATDAEESHACGVAATKAAVSGISGQMVKIVRESSQPYKWTTGLQPLGDIANVEHFLPRDWIAEDGLGVNQKFVDYAAPLIVGRTQVPEINGLPAYSILAKHKLAKKLPPRG